MEHYLRVGQVIRAGAGEGEVYEVVELLGEGRTSHVYKVRELSEKEADPIFISQRVAEAEFYALKIARDASQTLNQRIVREWKAHHNLGSDPGLPENKNEGFHDGRAFIIRELLTGLPLVLHLKEQGRIRYRVLMQLFEQLARAVAGCHRLGVAHRDIRPSNIMVEPERGPVLFDFETCALLFEMPDSLEKPSGAAEYTPPEALDPDAPWRGGEMAADVYALGVLLYSFLTGRLPVKRTAQDVAGYLRELRDRAPVPVTEANPEAPAACAALAMRLLEKAGDRLPDAQDLPALVSEAMEADKAALFRLAPEYVAGAETMLPAFPPKATKRNSLRASCRLSEWAGAIGELVAAQAELIAARVRAVAAFAMPAAVCAFALFAFLAHRAARAEDRADQRAEKAAQAEEKAAQALTDAAHAQELLAMQASPPGQLSAQISGRISPQALSLSQALNGGLKMPEKADPNWLKPDKDGVCRNPRTREELRTQVVIRGSCWRVVGAKLPGERSCPRRLYDPPPEILKDPTVSDLHDSCFEPWTVDNSKALEPTP